MGPTLSRCVIIITSADNYVTQVRLDICHFMRRMARGCESKSHPLYRKFMGLLSSCIFEWDEADYNRLMSAKREELIGAGVRDPSPATIQKAITREELACHCKRQTRGATVTINLIEALLLDLTFSGAAGERLFRDDKMAIWKEQKKHLVCLQDPPGVSLYTVTRSISKGGVALPVLRCARGTTLLESFHLHLARYCNMVYKSSE